MAPARQRQTTPAPRHLPGRKATPVDPDRELLHFNVRLAKSRQALADTNRLERKAFREHARVENAVAAYTRELCSLLDERGFTKGVSLSRIPEGGDSVLIVQLSDLHFNERVELPSNRYDFTVAAQRLAKLAARARCQLRRRLASIT
jgi:hypothetical protein